MATKKSESTAQYLMDILNQRLSSVNYPVPVSKNYTSDNPTRVYLTINADGMQDAIIVVEQQAQPSSGAKDALGISQRAYAPTIIRLGYEAGSPATQGSPGSGGTAASQTVTLGTPSNNDDIIIGGAFFTAKTSGANPAALQFNIGGTPTITAANLATLIATTAAQNAITVPITASSAGAVLTLTAAAHTGVYGNFINISTNNGTAFAIGGGSATFVGGVNDTTPASYGTAAVPGCSDSLRAILAIECARVGAELRVYEATGLTQSALDNDTNLVTVFRDLRFGMMADV